MNEKLVEAIKNGKLIIFTGAGSSKTFGLPDWKQMVIDIINQIGSEEFNHFIKLLESNIMQPIDVLEYLKTYDGNVRKYIKKEFNITNTEKDFLFHKKILKLSSKIITTNYDNAFELASNNSIIPSKPTSKYNISEVNKRDEPFILKIHGSFDEPDRCIVFKDDYEKLYLENNNEAAPEKLKALFSENTFLFLGFSFSDPDINLIFNRLDKVFGSYNKHFIITTEFDKFKQYKFLEPIQIESFSKLEEKIDQLIAVRSDYTKTDSLEELPEKEKLENNKKIAVLYPDTLDIDFGEEFRAVIKPFEEIDATLFIGSLNINTLQQIENFDLLIIISRVYKDKIYIEDDNLKSNLLSLKDICENILNDSIPILIITNEKIEIDLDYSLINISSYKNNIIKRFIFKLVKEKKFEFDDLDINSNKNLWKLEIRKGENLKTSFYSNNRDLEFGRKCLNDVIGRIEEQISIASRLLAIRNTNRILNIKASGGLGKTTLIRKMGYELYNRGYYTDGVNFKSCENIKDYNNFEDLLIEGFNLNNILNFKEYLIENYSSQKIDLLLILDNFETVINNLPVNELNDAIELLKFSSDYANIVITSREKISNEDFEDVYTLSQMTTDDAVELFQKFYKKKYTEQELKILREEILEDLLANNPLAIKLVTTSRPSINIIELKKIIENNFFESINEEYSDVFKNNADLNIERTKSIYQSINYSYTSLNTRQKLAFELLSLFPDGISLSNFKKCFTKSTSSNNISDTELKQLENKSLLENYNGVLQLQPIIRRFADFQFNKHKDNKQKYCIDAYNYNCYILDLIDLVQRKKSNSVALRLFGNQKNNLIKVVDYMRDIKIQQSGSVDKKEYLLNYIYGLYDYITNENMLKYFNGKLKNVVSFFSDVDDAKLLMEVMSLNKIYFVKEFDKSYLRLAEIFPVENIIDRNFKEENIIEKRWKNLLINIHNMEGYTLNHIQALIKNENYSENLFTEYHYLGIENIDIINNENSFYYFENKFRKNELNEEEIEKYIDSLHMEELLETMQCTYTLSKISKISKRRINKLVVTNPYTKGLKELMLAFISDLKNDKLEYFEKALDNLFHIKYYYLEALYYYCLFLKEIDINKYKEKVKEGLDLARKFKYQYLDYIFSNIENTAKENYDFSYEYYEVDGLKEFVKKDIEDWKKISLDMY